MNAKFLISLSYTSSQNVSYFKLKQSIFSMLELYVEFSQFLRGATEVSNKIRAVELTSKNNCIS